MIACVGLVVGAGLNLAGGCGGSGVEEATPLDGGRPGLDSEARADATATWDVPPIVFDGWEQWLDFDPRCGFAIRQPDEPLPPLSWDACGPMAGAYEAGCRMMRFEWDPPVSFVSEWISPTTSAYHRDDGTLALVTSRSYRGAVVRTIVDADGPVRSALLETGACVLLAVTSRGEQYAWGVHGLGANGKYDVNNGGAIGGTLGDRPRVIYRANDGVAHDFVAGHAGLLNPPQLELFSWTDGKLIANLRQAGDEGLFTSEIWSVGDTFIWNNGNRFVSREKIWSPGVPTQSLLTAGDVATHGYADLGTDGVHMVWDEGHRTDTANAYPRVDVVVSPYATTTAGLVPRVFRSDVTGAAFGIEPWVVGCGYAARYVIRESTPGIFANELMLLRLSDGVAWHLADPEVGVFRWRKVLALTCDELFGLVDITPPNATRYFNVARIRLDALGPGDPPPPQ